MLVACSGDRMLLSIGNYCRLFLRDVKCACCRGCSLPLCHFRQTNCLRWVTQSIPWAPPYRGSLRRSHSVSASGAGSISSSNMVLSCSAICCWAVTDLYIEAHLASYHSVTIPAVCATHGPCLSYVMDVALSDYDVADQMPMF